MKTTCVIMEVDKGRFKSWCVPCINFSLLIIELHSIETCRNLFLIFQSTYRTSQKFYYYCMFTATMFCWNFTWSQGTIVTNLASSDNNNYYCCSTVLLDHAHRDTLWHFVMSIVKYRESHYVTVLDMYD